MESASERVMGKGYACRVEADIVRYPDRYMNERGEVMFGKVFKLLRKLQGAERPNSAFS